MAISLRLSKRLEQQLKQAARFAGVSASEYLRRCLQKELESEENRPSAYELGKDLFGKYGSGRPNLSVNAEKIVKEIIRARLVAIDSGPVVGLFSRDDVNHAAAMQFFRGFRDRGFVTVAVVTEVMHLLSFRVDAQLDFLRWLRRGAVVVLDLEETDWERIEFLTGKYANVPMDFGDSSLVAICERIGTRFIATVDSDFDVYRFQNRLTFQNLFGQ